MRVRASLFWGATVVALAAVVAFLALPVVAIFLRVPPGPLYTSDVALDALQVTATTSLAANLLFLAFGTPTAYLLAMGRFRGRAALLTLCELPLVLPPAVAGIGLLVAFGRAGVLGGELAVLGISLPFTQAAVVLAVVFVAGPFYVRGAVAAFESVDRTCLDAARTLGAPPGRVFARVAVPMAAGGLTSAWALAFARGVGEFGATIIFAGSLQGVTQTLPLAVYGELQRDLDTALAIGGLLVMFAACLLVAVKLIPTWPFTSSSPWRSPGAGSPSPPTSR